MTTQESFNEWQALTSYFERWVQTRSGSFETRSDQRSFANHLINANVDDLKLRLVCDRGTFLLDVSIGTTWHSGRNVLAFDARLTPAAALRINEFDGAVLTLSIPQIKRILRDRRFEDFENELSELSLQRLESSVADQRSRAHA